MSPLSRNPRDATIQLRDIQRWGRCRGSLRGRSHGRHVHRPSLDRWLALTGISFGSVLLCPPFRGPGGPLRGCGLVRSRCPDQLLASCPRSRRPRGCGLVRSRCPDQLLASCPRSRRFHGCGLVRSRRPDQPLASCPGSRRFHGCGLVRSRCPDQLLASCPRSRRFHGCGLVWSRRPDQPLASRPGSRRFHGCGLVRSRCPDQLLASCPRSCRPRGCGLVWSRRPDQLLASCPRSCRPRGCGLVWSRRPDQLLASCRGGRSLRGYDLVRSRRPEHGVEHAEQLPGHRHDGPLLTAAMHQPSEQGRPFRAVADQPPGCLHQCPPQQSRAFLGDLQVLGLPLPTLPDHRHQSRVGTDSLGVAESADVSQLAEDHLGRHGTHPRGGLEDLPGLAVIPGHLSVTHSGSPILTVRS